MKILIAEDDNVSRKLLSTTLKKWDHEVIEAIDGEDAIDKFAEHNDIQLAILDWMMPNLAGVEVCKALKESETNNKSLYVIMLTAKTQKEDLAHAFDMGTDDYVAKPFDTIELQARVNAGIRTIKLQNALNIKIAELQEALDHVKQLEGIVPICAWCKRVRNDSDFWDSVEDYFTKYTEAKFSHGICPDCMKEKYGDDLPEDDQDTETSPKFDSNESIDDMIDSL